MHSYKTELVGGDVTFLRPAYEQETLNLSPEALADLLASIIEA